MEESRQHLAGSHISSPVAVRIIVGGPMSDWHYQYQRQYAHHSCTGSKIRSIERIDNGLPTI